MRPLLVGLALALLACSGGKKASGQSMRHDASIVPAANGMHGGGGAHASSSGAATHDAAITCTSGAAPDDEFSVACPETPPVDAGAADGSANVAPRADAGHAVTSMPDAAVPLDAGHDASAPPAAPDEGMCAARDAGCELGHAATTLGSATCTIAGNSLSVDRQICEVCGKSTNIIDFSLTVMDCDSCTPFYSEGYFTTGIPLQPGECTTRTDPGGDEWTTVGAACVDIYANTASGDANITGTLIRSNDLVRVCRCDRTTGTCASCANGACDSAP